MALVFMDGFDHYSSTQAECSAEMLNSGKYQKAGNIYINARDDIPYPDGIGRSLYFDDVYGLDGRAETKTFTITGNKIIIGFHIYSTNYNFNYFGDFGYPLALSTGGGTTIFSFSSNSDLGEFYWMLGGVSPDPSLANPKLSNTLINCPQGTWVHIGIEVDLATDATGRAKLFVNGNEVADEQNIQTATALDGTFKLKLGFSNDDACTGDFHLDNLVVMDGSGTKHNAFPGVMRILPLKPTSTAETGAGMTSSSGSDPYLDVDDTGLSDSTADWVSSATTGERMLYGIEDAATVWPDIQSVLAVEVVQHVGTDAPDFSVVRNVINDGTNTVESDDANVTAVAPRPVTDQFVDAPDGGDWNLAKLQALKIGHKHQG
ncbi:polysaccharide lyase [Ferrimonas balearica]|uniref:polysaccharide lyase n=1 Tax=Ferrimonas balearica TaxID=44012 RepID=UPI001F2CEF26|nr:polysaccharide lyase [Ferrimonas balearica]MBY6093843.1 polysaccharide lyase [Ferrimonas balearica]